MITNLQIKEFFEKQKELWPDFNEHLNQLTLCEYKEFKFNKYSIKVQINPARIVSSGAKVDKESISRRKCFLCAENRPKEQINLNLNERFSLLVNPFPILEEHFTISCKEHIQQEIKNNFIEMLNFSEIMTDHILFYNGAKCGASAPDHMHFQAIKKGQLPLEKEWQNSDKKILSECKYGKIEEITNFGRKCIHIEATRKDYANSYFSQIYTQYQLKSGSENEEPLMNIFCEKEYENFHIFVFPRKKHRPSQYFEEGEKFFMISPGAIDMAGILVLPRKEDFERIDRKIIENVYSQV